MKLKYYCYFTLILLLFVSCSRESMPNGDEKKAEDYLRGQGYKIAARKGELEKYTLEKSQLENIPYQQAWGVQKAEPDQYFGKEITVYGFTVKNHPLNKFWGTTNVYVMLAEGQVIGGYSFPNAEMTGTYYSIDGQTLEEVTGLSFSEWRKLWKEKYD
nr:DUF4830 domain-containing protein [Aneurinibacillus sp. XH2]